MANLAVLITFVGLLGGSLCEFNNTLQHREKRQSCNPGTVNCQCAPGNVGCFIVTSATSYAQSYGANSYYGSPVYTYGSAYTSCNALTTRPDVQDCAQLGSSLYFVIRNTCAYNGACQACQALGGSLATIKNFQTYSALVSFTNMAYVSTLWIGASSLQFQGNFVWSDNTAMTYNMWLPGFPVSDSRLQCVLATSSSLQSTVNQPPLIGWSDNSIGWANADCNWPTYPLCQINLAGGSIMG